MPYRKRYNKRKFKRKRRGGARRYNSRRPRKQAIGWMPNVASQRVVKHRYNETFNITSTLGAIGEHVFRANSMFDPNFTGLGHQPMGFDQMSILYKHYAILGSKVKCQWLADTATTQPWIVGTYLNNAAATIYTSSDELIEARRGSHATALGRHSVNVTTSGKFSAKRFFNVADVKDNFSTLGALTTTNPTDQAYWHFWFEMQNGVTDAITLLVTIDYITAYFEPSELPLS